MTYKPLDEMTAEEIRLEIAERKGWKYCVTAHRYTATHDGGITAVGTPVYGFVYGGGISTPPNWPESIEAAWELAKEIGKHCCFNVQIDYNGATCFLREVPTFYHELITEHAPTAPLAICKAWLAWKRSEDK